MPGLSDAIGDLFVKVRPDTTGFGAEAAAGVTAQGGAVTKGTSKLGRNIGLGLAAGAAGAFAKGLGDFVDFERGLNEVFTLIPDAGDAAFDDLTAKTKEFASEFGVLPQEVIQPLYDSLSAGVPRDNVFNFLEEANKFAKAGATDLSTAVDGLTTGVNAFGLEAGDAGRLSDSLFTAVKGGKTTVDELASSLFQVAPIAGSIGVEVEEVSAAFATLTAAGTPTRQVATQLKAAFSELTKTGSKSDKAFREFAGKGVQDFIDQGGTFAEVVQIMEQGAKDAGTPLNDLFGSTEAYQAIVGLTGEKAEVFAGQLDAQANAAGATQEAFERMEQGIGPALDKIKARLSVAFIELGTTIAPAVEAAGTAIADFVLIISKLPGPVLAAVVAGIGLAGAMLALAGPILKVIQVMKLLGGAFTLLGANPIVLIVLAIAAAAFLIYKNWEPIKEFFVKLWDGISKAFSGFFDSLTDYTSVIGGFVDLFGQIFSRIGDVISTAFTDPLEAIQKFGDLIVDVWNLIKGIITTLFTGDFSGATGGGFKLFEDSGVVKAIFALRDFVKDFVGKFADLFKPISGALEGVVGFFQSAWDTVFGIFDAVIDFIKDWWRLLIIVFLGPLGILINLVIVHWDTIKAVTETVFGAIVDFFTATWEIIWNLFQMQIDLIVGIVTTAWEVIRTITETAWEVIRTVFETVWGAIQSVVETVVGIISGVINAAIAVWDGYIFPFLDRAQRGFERIFNAIRSVVETVVGVVSGVLNTVFGPAIDGVRVIIETLGGIWDSVWNGIKDVIGRVADTIINTINRIKDAASDALGPLGDVIGFGGNVAGGIFNAGKTLIGKAEGGPVNMGQQYLVGEEGPELFTPGRSGTITPNDELGGGGGVTIAGPLVAFSGPVNIRSDRDIVDLSRRLADDANSTLRAQGKVGNAS